MIGPFLNSCPFALYNKVFEEEGAVSCWVSGQVFLLGLSYCHWHQVQEVFLPSFTKHTDLSWGIQTPEDPLVVLYSSLKGSLLVSLDLYRDPSTASCLLHNSSILIVNLPNAM